MKRNTFHFLFILSMLSMFLLASCEKDDLSIKGELPNKQLMLDIVNTYRTQGYTLNAVNYAAVNAVTWNDRLATAARKHAQDMQDNNYFAHESLDGRTSFDRILDEGYQFAAAGENIAKGYFSEETVMDAWMNSPGHCANIMTDQFTEMGVGISEDGTYWVQVFGSLN